MLVVMCFCAICTFYITILLVNEFIYMLYLESMLLGRPNIIDELKHCSRLTFFRYVASCVQCTAVLPNKAKENSQSHLFIQCVHVCYFIQFNHVQKCFIAVVSIMYCAPKQGAIC